MTAKNKVGKVWNITFTVIVVIVVLIAAFLAGTRIMGFKVFNVISGSMRPTYNVGDLVYVKETPASEIRVGDAITFVLNENLVVATHRVVRISEDRVYFYTKGDANEVEDAEPVHYENIEGVVEFAIPGLGYVSDFIQHPPGTYITIGLGLLLIVALFLPEIIQKFLAKKHPEVMTEAPEKTEAEIEKKPAEEPGQTS